MTEPTPYNKELSALVLRLGEPETCLDAIDDAIKWMDKKERETIALKTELATVKQRLEEAEVGAKRYEYVRKLNVRQYGDLIFACLQKDCHFDAEIDRRIEEVRDE